MIGPPTISWVKDTLQSKPNTYRARRTGTCARIFAWKYLGLGHCDQWVGQTRKSCSKEGVQFHYGWQLVFAIFPPQWKVCQEALTCCHETGHQLWRLLRAKRRREGQRHETWLGLRKTEKYRTRPLNMENLHILAPTTLGKSLKSRVRTEKTEKKLTPPSHVRMAHHRNVFPNDENKTPMSKLFHARSSLPSLLWDVPTQMFPAGRLVIQRGSEKNT